MYLLIEGISASNLLDPESLTVNAVLLSFIVYLIKDNRALRQDINDVVNKHIKDLKENNNNTKEYLDKWNALTQEIKDIIRSK